MYQNKFFKELYDLCLKYEVKEITSCGCCDGTSVEFKDGTYISYICMDNIKIYSEKGLPQSDSPS